MASYLPRVNKGAAKSRCETILENQSAFERINTVPGQQTYAIVTRTPQQAQQGKAANYSEINYQKYPIHLVIEETKSLSLVTAILVEVLKKDLRRMLMVRMYILNVLVEQALNIWITMLSRH